MCSVPAGVCVSSRCLGSILLPQHISWVGAEVLGNSGTSLWNGQGELRQERWGWTSLAFSGSSELVRMLTNYSLFPFSTLALNPFSLSHSANAGGSFPFWWSNCWREGFIFWGLILVSQFHWIWCPWIWSVRFQRGFGFLPSKSGSGEPFSSVWNIDLQQDSLCKLEVHFGVVVWTFQGFCMVFPRSLLATMVWTLVLVPNFLSAQESLVGWADGAQPVFEMSFWIDLIIEAKISALPFRKI